MKRRKGLEEEVLLILQHFHRFTYVTAHSPHYSSLTSLHLRHRSSNPSVASPTSQLVLQPFCRFTYITCTSPTSQLILLIIRPLRRFIYVTAHYPTLSSLHLRHSSFSNPSVASPTSHPLHLCHSSFSSIFIPYVASSDVILT